MGDEIHDQSTREVDRAEQLISEIKVEICNISRKLKIVLNDKVPNAGNNQSEDCELNRELAQTLNELQTLHATIAL